MAQWVENGNHTQITTTDAVGIGTTGPMGLLHVNGSNGGGLVVSGTNLDPNAGYSLTGLQNSGNLLVGWNRSAGGGEIDLISNRYAGNVGGFTFYDYTNSGSLNAILTVQGSGNVGIGTNTPGARLHVEGDALIHGPISVSGMATLGERILMGQLVESDPFTANPGVYIWQSEGKLGVIDVSSASQLAAAKTPLTPASILDLVALTPHTLGPVLTLTNAGGQPGASSAVDFNSFLPSTSGAYNPSARIEAVDDGNFANDIVFQSNKPGAPNNGLTESMRITSSGNVGIGVTAPTARLQVAGDISVSGDVILSGADCAEDFDSSASEPPEPGTVLVIAENGALTKSRSAYDNRVAGVVSGAGQYRHGLILDKRPSEHGRVPIALIGKVYCKADAQYAPIDVGDLLTTSPTEGHAMKAVDPSRAFGCVLGKALKRLEQGQGLIPILVTLQ